MEQNVVEGMTFLAVLLMAVGQKQSAASAEYEERRGMSGGEGIAVMHIDTGHNRQGCFGETLEGTYRTLQAEGVFQQLQESTAGEFAESHEEREADMLPQYREQPQRVDGAFGNHSVILEESVLYAGVPRIQQEMKLEFRIQTKQSKHDEK